MTRRIVSFGWSRYTVSDLECVCMARIGLNLLFLVPNEVGGTEYLTRNFIAQLCLDSTNTYVLFCNEENAPTFTCSGLNMSKVVCKLHARNRISRLLFEQFILPFIVAKQKCTILHSFGYTSPLILNAASIVTVHDANWLDHPEDFTFFSRLVTHILVTLACVKSKTVITDSEFSKQRLRLHLPWVKNKIAVVPPIISSIIYTPPFDPLPSILKGKVFALCVSAHYPHKKIPYLLECWKRVHLLEPTAYLVLVGQHGKDHSKVSEMIKNQDSVIYFPKVSFALLKTLYHYARVFVHPSVYEGFGYPVYEATLNNCPTLVGHKSLYSDSIGASLVQLQFDKERDSELIAQYVRKAKKAVVPKLWTAQESLQKLLSIYAN